MTASASNAAPASAIATGAATPSSPGAVGDAGAAVALVTVAADRGNDATRADVTIGRPDGLVGPPLPASAVSGAASSAAVAPATGAASPVPAWLPQALQSQLAGRLVVAARGSENGSVQRLTLHLHPADLGAVQVVATMDDGTVSLQLSAANPLTRDAMRAALAGLRSDLAAAGLEGARLDVSDQPPSQHNLPQQGRSSEQSARPFVRSDGVGGSTVVGTRDDLRAGHPGGIDVRPGRADASRGVDLEL